MNSPPNIDETDRRILRALRRDGRLSNTKLAEQVGLSTTPCWNRVRALEENGAELPEVIEAYLLTGEYDYLIKVAVAGTAAAPPPCCAA
eukprot:gene42481-52688_t